MPSKHPRRRSVSTWLLFAVSAVGLVAALALPFAPVHADTTTLTWPAPGEPVQSSTAQLVPYRPAELSATVPCAAIEAARARSEPTTVLATAPDTEGLVLRTDGGTLRLLPGDRVIEPASGRAGCVVTVHADASGIAVGGDLPGPFTVDAPVPKVFTFRTALSPDEAAGVTVTARTESPFATRPGVVKLTLVTIALLAAATSLVLLHQLSPAWSRRARTGPALHAVDAAVIAVLCAWAVIGPLAVDDGWATTIARNVADTGNAGNYYRWWDASESPFALSQQVLSVLTQVSVAPLWLRLPSTALGVGTWFVLSRGVLAAALPVVAATVRVRLLAATALLAAWLPFDLGTRPESYVAFGLVVVLALLWRARTPATLGWAVLTAALILPISPSAVMVAAPAAVFAPRAMAVIRRAASQLGQRAGLIAALCCVGAVSVVVVYADQTWDGVVTATRWHTAFGPSLPWYREPDRYRYLLGDDQQGSAAKRLPVLLSLALLPVVAALAGRRARRRNPTARSVLRIAAVVVLALLMLALAPSKWSYHLGAAAGLFAAMLTVSVVALARFTGLRTDRVDRVIAVLGGVLLAAAAALAFRGPNAWWLPVLYDVPWADGPIRPLGTPMHTWWAWLGVLIFFAAAAVYRRHSGSALLVGPAAVAVLATGLSVTMLLVSFIAAPARRPEGALALMNSNRLTGGPYCGLADDVEVLADGRALTRATLSPPGPGFVERAGFDPDVPPPDILAGDVWGSRGVEPGVGELVSAWFIYDRGTSVALSVNGRTDGANAVHLEFGSAEGNSVTALGPAITPVETSRGEDNSLRPAWRSIGLDAAVIPTDADRVRVRAVDGDPGADGWLAVTGPRERNVLSLNDFLRGQGPVLISWPQGFLFPCVHDTARVWAGVAQVPRVVITSPGPWFTEPTDQGLGGSFAALVPYGRFYEVPSRLAGHPSVDWGAVLVSADTTPHDTYRRETTTATRWGHRVRH